MPWPCPTVVKKPVVSWSSVWTSSDPLCWSPPPRLSPPCRNAWAWGAVSWTSYGAVFTLQSSWRCCWSCLPLALRSSTHAHLLARPGVPDHSLLMAHSCTCSSFWPSCLLPHPSYLASFLLQKRTAVPDLHTFPTHTGPSRKTSALSGYHLLLQ